MCETKVANYNQSCEDVQLQDYQTALLSHNVVRYRNSVFPMFVLIN